MIQELDDAIVEQLKKLQFAREQAWRNFKSCGDAGELECETMWMHIAETRDTEFEAYVQQVDQVYALLERMGIEI